MKRDYPTHTEENIRLIILRALAAEDHATLNDWNLCKELESHGYRKTPSFIQNQLVWLEKNTGSVRTWMLDTAMVAELTKAGRWHVERRHLLIGIQNPDDAD